MIQIGLSLQNSLGWQVSLLLLIVTGTISVVYIFWIKYVKRMEENGTLAYFVYLYC